MVPTLKHRKTIKQMLTDLKGEINNKIIVGTSNPHYQQWIDCPDISVNKKMLGLKGIS